MNRKVLLKCIEELRTENPRKDYILGMLETLAEVDSVPYVQPKVTETNMFRTPGDIRPVETSGYPLPTRPLSDEERAGLVAAQSEAELAAMAGLIERNLQTETNIALGTGK